jgi:hypothetical protein
MDNVVIGSILTVAGAAIVFVFLAFRLRSLMNKKPD